MVLEVSINGGITYHALNDLVVDRGESFRMLKCSLSMNGNLITNYSADGLILATRPDPQLITCQLAVHSCPLALTGDSNANLPAFIFLPVRLFYLRIKS
jgi:hypothetical protein